MQTDRWPRPSHFITGALSLLFLVYVALLPSGHYEVEIQASLAQPQRTSIPTAAVSVAKCIKCWRIVTSNVPCPQKLDFPPTSPQFCVFLWFIHQLCQIQCSSKAHNIIENNFCSSFLIWLGNILYRDKGSPQAVLKGNQQSMLKTAFYLQKYTTLAEIKCY